MSERDPLQESDHVPNERRVLDYMAPRNDTRLLSADTSRAVAGAVMTVIGVFGWVFIALNSTVRIYPGPGTPPPDYATPLVCGAALIAILSTIGAMLWLRHRSLSFVKGCLIGLGVAVLIEGACFAAMQ